MYLFGFGTSETVVNEVISEEVSLQVETVSKELVSSGSGEVLLFGALILSIIFAIFSKKFA